MSDPTYVDKLINMKPEWELAFFLSELMNDNAPIGWGKYISTAENLLATYDIKRRVTP